ncbi:hypothetical protein DICPUDRAFT_89812 [Dictyostelium purpureum]|uniref:N-acetyltransferase domain-containing protein n=1 Tax=Dictyostelium purpureum TaxID=5786 RepID=F0ZYB9_DICPU|nr:uncharacterized protein DICPUDRAFT_89812 [Dictyostelium purpureum]EGC31051.1 hypothetical protein DICPUDRAFT_89812 [Dictyostelium purpureum]|eukprot:XP_003292410.1 hypothetical protein DICPUDRAFT_89812 [Dictyostelium purpureum]
MNIKFLNNNFNLKQITETFNEAFSDYVVKLVITEDSLIQKIKGENVSSKHSCGVFDQDGSLVAFILHAVDNDDKPTQLYNSATGVVPNSRSKRLVDEQYKMMIPLFREQGIKSVILEVISTNERAIKVYDRCGYKTVRMVSSYRGDLKKDTLQQYLNQSIKIKKAQQEEQQLPQDLIDFVNQYSECKPSYSNSIDCIKREFEQKLNEIWVAYGKDQVTGNEIIVGLVSIHTSSKRIRQILIHPNFRNQNIATTLVYKMLNDINDNTNLCYNIANIDQSYVPLLNFFNKRLNLPYLLSQKEMLLEL